ncbi:MAG: transglycosylase domain-containing protein, partial [Calditrichia bacterium]|nr:transglycosylase domain-containing protein [Calditrichia bacterium]
MVKFLKEKKKEKKKKRSKKKSLKKFFINTVIISLIFMVIGIASIFILSRNLASVQQLERVDPAVATRIYSADGKVIHRLFMMKRLYIPISKIPDYVIKALLSSEDKEFYYHWGVNIKGIPRAILANLLTGKKSQGFSTITMQASRNLYSSIGFEKSYTRKIKEILTAVEMEKNYSKEEILEMYINAVYFGHGVYGLEAASKKYFNKQASELTVDEGAMLVGLLPSPERYSPFNNLELAMNRKKIVLNNMVKWAGLSKTAYDTLKNKPLQIFEGEEKPEVSPYFTEYVRIQLNQLQEALDVNVYEDGLHVFTTLDTRLQAAMDSSVRKWYPVIQQEIRENETKVEMKEEMGDSLFNEKTVLQLGFISIEPGTGHILAMIGGADFSKYKYNHVMQPRRQPGSVFKPVLYTAAIDNGYTPIDKYLSQPIVVENADGTRWTP